MLYFFQLRKEFSNDVESAIAAVRALSATAASAGQADLTNLFRLAAHEAKKSRAQNRILRVVSVQFFFALSLLLILVNLGKELNLEPPFLSVSTN